MNTTFPLTPGSLVASILVSWTTLRCDCTMFRTIGAWRSGVTILLTFQSAVLNEIIQLCFIPNYMIWPFFSLLKVYVEYSNEVWNGIFRQTQYTGEKGRIMFPREEGYKAGMKYFNVRATEVATIWNQVNNRLDLFWVCLQHLGSNLHVRTSISSESFDNLCKIIIIITTIKISRAIMMNDVLGLDA